MRAKIVVREAREDDREAVFKFCKHTFPWGDYIPQVWDSWLKETNSKTFVATINDSPIGIMNVLIPKRGEAWLRGARTHPNYRRHGIATALTNACLKYAAQTNAKVARLATESNNFIAQKALEKLNFNPVSVFVNLTCNKLKAPPSQHSRWASINDQEAIWRLLKNSECFKKSAGLYTVLYTWYSLDKKELTRFLRLQKAIIHEDKNDQIDGLTLIDESPKTIWKENAVQTCYIDGDFKSTVDMLKLLKQHCRETKTEFIYGFACNHEPIIKALTTMKFNTSNESEIIYEKQLSP